jgi:hypothetical protein
MARLTQSYNRLSCRSWPLLGKRWGNGFLVRNGMRIGQMRLSGRVAADHRGEVWVPEPFDRGAIRFVIFRSYSEACPVIYFS